MAKVKGIYPLNNEDVYNMEVENHHNYSVNGGFILHNCDSLRCFCIARLIPVKQPQEPRHFNFNFEKPKPDNYFGNMTDEYMEYGG